MSLQLVNCDENDEFRTDGILVDEISVDENLVDQIQQENDSIFEFIRRVESRSFLYNCRDPKHCNRDVINNAWSQISQDLKINGKGVNAFDCRRRWKTLRDYYFKVKKTQKGKSGDGAKNKKPWIYFNAMHRVLSSYNDENPNTQTNFPGDDSQLDNESTSVQSSGDCDNGLINQPEQMETTESTQTEYSANKNAKKRKAIDDEAVLTQKIIKILEEPDEVKDQFYHFGMTISSKLRTAPPQTAEYAMLRISSLLYEIMYPVNQHATNESTPAPHTS